MSAFGLTDLPALLADMGETFTVSGTDYTVLVDERDQYRQTESGLAVTGTVTVLTGRTSDLSGLSVDASGTLRSTTYYIRDIRAIGDGALTELAVAS